MSLVVAIEGNPGAGKSTFLAKLQAELPACATLPEPIDKWRHTGVLQAFYGDPRRWAYAFQSYAFLSRLQAQTQQPQPQPLTFIERSVWSDKHVFAAHCRAAGLFTPMEGAMYDDWHGWLMGAFAAQVRLDGIIYLRATPAVAHQRVQARGRAEEQTLTLAYLEELHARHEEWLLPRDASRKVLVVDADAVDWDDRAGVARLMARVRAFVADLA